MDGWTEAYGIAQRTLKEMGVVDPYKYGSIEEYRYENPDAP